MNTEPTDSNLDAIDALLSGEPVEGQEEAEVGDDQGAEENVDLTAADRASEDTDDIDTDSEEEDVEEGEEEDPEGDLETSEIDYDLEIPLGDGRDPVKLGVLKDAYQNLEREKSSVDEQRMKVIADEQELNSFMGQSGIEIPQGFRDHMQRQQEQHLQVQHELMIKMLPEMVSKESFSEMRKGIVKTAMKSNFTEHDISQISDARVVHALHRLAVLEARELKAQETVKEIKGKPKLKSVQRRQKAGSKTETDKLVKRAMGSNNRDTKDAAIAALLN